VNHQKPNILLISIDSLRADHLSLYDYPCETTPYLSHLAQSGIVFENAFAASNWTGAAVASLITGLYPTTHGYNNHYYYLLDGRDSLASILAERNYYTICFSNNLYISSQTGLTQGFIKSFYRGSPEAPSIGRESAILPLNGFRLWAGMKNLVPPCSKHLLKNVLDSFDHGRALRRDDGAYATEVAFGRFLQQHATAQPFFAYIHYQEPHSVYCPPYPFRRRFFSGSWIDECQALSFDHMRYFAGKTEFSETQVNRYKELYDGEIAYLDWRLGRLFDLLKSTNQYDNTLIVVTADHGEMFGEHGYFWHAFCLYEPLMRVPLVIRYPEWFSPECRRAEIVQTNDIVPTILEGLGVDWQYKNEGQGTSFLNGSSRTAAFCETDNPEMMIDRWLNRNNDLKRIDFQHYFRDLTAMRTKEDKLIEASDGLHEFYQLSPDPQESQNLFDLQSEVVKKRMAELVKWRETLKPHPVSSNHQSGFDKTTWEKMRALGYA